MFVVSVNIDEKHAHILYKLWRNTCFGKGHMLPENLLTGFPKNEKKEYKEALNELIKRGIVCIKPTAKGNAYYINLQLREQVKHALLEYYDFL